MANPHWFQGVHQTEIHRTYTNMSFSTSNLTCMAGNCLAPGLTCVLYCIMVVSAEQKRGRMKYECVGGNKSYHLRWWVVESANILRINKVHGDLHRTYANWPFFCFWFVLDVGKAFSTCSDLCFVNCDGCNRCNKALEYEV